MKKTFYKSPSTVPEQRNVPRAKGYPIIGQTPNIVRDPLGFLLHLKKSNQGLVKIRLGLRDYILIQSPSAARHVLQEHAKNFYKPGAAKLMKKMLGDGLATSNGELWLRQRRLIQPAFHKQKLNDFLEIIKKETEELVEKWSANAEWQEVDVSKEFLRLTLNNITKAMFSSDVDSKMDEIADVLKKMQVFSSETTKKLFKIPLSIPTKKNSGFKKSVARFEKIIFDIINLRRTKTGEELKGRNDLLQILLSDYDDESKTVMTEKQLRDEITTIFMAGHETTSQTLGWIFYRLALHPQYYHAIEEEVASEKELKSFDQLQKFVYTKSVIEEALRYYPPVWIIARKSAAADIIDGYYIPAGSTVLINVYGLHRENSHWRKAAEFSPSNFSKEAKEEIIPFSYLPFGGGQRLCIGHHFAMMVMQTVVARLVENFEFKIPPGFVPRIDPNLTLRAKNGIILLVKKK